MSHNLGELGDVARFAQNRGLEVFYQPIEQNYNTLEDPAWFEHSDNWPSDPREAVAAVRELIELKGKRLPIANSVGQLAAMITYFSDPASLRVATHNHSAHERQQYCLALTTLQIQANGDVTVCVGRPPVGNIKASPIREIWRTRPRLWQEGCCLANRLTEHEQRAHRSYLSQMN
jgi:MoaA/NifB/PqqE/SkfB family radical SAM enzyme